MTFEDIVKLRINMRQEHTHYWLSDNFLSWQWFLLVALNLGALIVAWIYMDRKRLLELYTYAGFVLAIGTLLDMLVLHFNFTAYEVSIAPIIPSLVTTSYIVLPVIYLLIYQYNQSWKHYIFATLISSSFNAFVTETFLIWIGVYQYLKWKHIYSFFLFLTIGILSKLFIEIVKKCKKNQ